MQVSFDRVNWTTLAGDWYPLHPNRSIFASNSDTIKTTDTHLTASDGHKIPIANQKIESRVINMSGLIIGTDIYDVREKLMRDNKADSALFVNYYGQRLTRQGLWKILKSYGGKANISHKLTPNTIRNSFAVHMIQNGADLKSLQELLGHDITATQVYLTTTENRIKDVYDKTHPRA